MAGLSYNEDGDAWNMPRTATRHLSSYGFTPTNAPPGMTPPIRNTYSSIIHSQAPLPMAMRECGREPQCGNCYRPVHGPGQPQWVDQYNDNMSRLMVASDVRDRIIQKAYEDLANSSSQIASKPVLCKALARLYDVGPWTPLKTNVNWTDEEWRVAKWYQSNCGNPLVTASGNVSFYNKPLLPRSAVDSLIRSLGPVFDINGCKGCDFGQNACPCAPESGERAVYARRPTQLDIQRYQQLFAQPYVPPNELDARQQLRRMYGLVPEGPAGDAVLREQQAIVQDQRALRDFVNPDYDARVYDARVDEWRRQQAGKQTRIGAIMDNKGNTLAMGHGQ